MTKEKAREVMDSLINSGYNASVLEVLPDDWQIRANNFSFIDNVSVDNFASSHQVNVEMYQVSTEVSFR